MFEAIAFYFFAIVSISMFAISVFSKNVLYAMTSLAGGMIFISGFFFLLGAEFLGVVQIMVYTGAVMVLYGFSMMFFDTAKPVKEGNKSQKLLYTLGFFCAFLLVIIIAMPIASDQIQAKYTSADTFQTMYEVSGEIENTELIGLIIFTKYLIVFELAAVMLLVAMICGIVLVHKDMDRSLSIEEENE